MDAFDSMLLDLLSKNVGSFAAISFPHAMELLNEWQSIYRTIASDAAENAYWTELECKPIQFIDDAHGGGVDCSIGVFSNGRELSCSIFVPRKGPVEVNAGVYDHDVAGLPRKIGVLNRDPAISCVWVD